MMASAQNDPRHAGTIWAMDLHQPRPAIKPSVPADFRQLGPASAELLTAAMQAPSVAEVLRRFRSGGRCYTAWVDGHLASYGWVSFKEEYVGEFNLRVRLLPGEAYIWDCYTVPAFRRHGLYAALLADMLCDLEAGPVCRTWIGADSDNIASQRGIARAGFRAVADMVLARVFAMRLVWVQGRPGMPEGAVAEARRAFLDNRDTVWLRAMELLKDGAQSAAQSPLLPLPDTGRSDHHPVPGNHPTADDTAASHPAA
jgi:GNAT superfamily N-acetyltransferase